jgi:hypothetical protein
MKQVEIKEYTHGGKGLFALQQEMIYLEASYSDCITLDSIKAKLNPLLFKDEVVELDEKSWFLIYLMYGMIFPEDEYLRSLPTSFNNHPMFSNVESSPISRFEGSCHLYKSLICHKRSRLAIFLSQTLNFIRVSSNHQMD